MEVAEGRGGGGWYILGFLQILGAITPNPGNPLNPAIIVSNPEAQLNNPPPPSIIFPSYFILLDNHRGVIVYVDNIRVCFSLHVHILKMR